MEFVERERQLAEIRDAWRRTRLGNGHIVLVSGEAGIGKTSLIEYFLASQEKTARVLRGACDDLFSPQPLGPFIEIAMQIQPDLPRLTQGVDRLAFSTALLGYLQKSSTPVMIILEDLHWADEATLDVIKFLGRRIMQTKTLLILSYRDDEISRNHPLRFLLGGFSASRTLRLVLPRLSQEAVERLAQQAQRRLEGLYHATGGNPFFVTEIIASGAVGIPASVRDAVLARFAKLSPAAKAIVELASLAPGAAEAWLIQAILHPASEALDECEEGGILHWLGDSGAGYSSAEYSGAEYSGAGYSSAEYSSAEYSGAEYSGAEYSGAEYSGAEYSGAEYSGTVLSVAFRHELARQAVADSLPVGKSRELHAKILAALLEREGETAPLARIVHHALGAGDEAAIVRFAPQAARQASTLGAHREAASLYRSVLRYRHRLAPEVQAALIESLSFENYLTGAEEEAIQDRQQVIALWNGLGYYTRAGDSTRWLSRMYWAAGKQQEAMQYAELAIEILQKQPIGPELAMAFSNKSQLHMLAWEVEPALMWGNRAIELAEQLGAVEIWVHAMTNVGSTEYLIDFERANQKIEHALQIARQQGMHEHAARCYSNLASSYIQLRRYDQARHWFEEGLEYTTARDLDLYSVYLRGWQAHFYFVTGRWAEAEASAVEALHLARSETIIPIPALIALGHLKVRQGDPGAMEFLDRARALSAPTGELQRLGPLAAARAEAAWWRGDVAQSAAEASDVFPLALSRGEPWICGQIGYWMWQTGERDIPLDRLAAPYADMLRGEWQAAAQAWEQLGSPFEQALALAEGDPAAQLQALAIFEQLGARPAAHWLRMRLRAQGAADLPPEAGPSRTATSRRIAAGELTRRETEVLQLIAAGYANPVIAEKLTISVGTVKAHTSSIYNKLGVSNRVQALSRARELHIL